MHLCVAHQHSQFWPILARFLDYYSPFWGPEAISIVVEPQDAYVSVINTHSFGRLWPISWTITHHLGAPKRFPWLLNPKVRLRVGHQQSQLPILARFLDYYSVLGPQSDIHD